MSSSRKKSFEFPKPGSWVDGSDREQVSGHSGWLEGVTIKGQYEGVLEVMELVLILINFLSLGFSILRA